MTSKSVVVTDYRTQIPGGIVAGNGFGTWYFPQINSINANGSKSFWHIKVRLVRPDYAGVPSEDADDAFVPILDEYFDATIVPAHGWIKVDSGIEGGKIRKVVPNIVRTGKNLGRRNATNAFTQALRDAYGEYLKQVNKASTTCAHGGTVRYPPMLASLLGDTKIDFTQPVFVQRKYDGVRAVAVYDPAAVQDALGQPSPLVTFYSRAKKTFSGFGYMRDELLPGLRAAHELGLDIYLDGEMFKEGMPLQDISGYSRREDKPTDLRVNFMVYDAFVPSRPEMTYVERKQLLDDFFQEHGPFEYIKPVETFLVESQEKIMTLYEQFLQEHYEGAIVRLNTPYKYSVKGYRGRTLLKLKPTFDAEFEVIGYETGTKGKAAEALMFICMTSQGIRFNVTPAMELVERIALAKKMGEPSPDHPEKTYFEDRYLGKKLIVTFDEWSKDEVPQRARTQGVVRDWD